MCKFILEARRKDEVEYPPTSLSNCKWDYKTHKNNALSVNLFMQPQ